MKVKAIFDYKSDYDEDLSFDAGTIINIISVENDEWYSGEYDGKQGMFPKNFVEELKEPTTAESSGNSDQPAIPEEPKPAQPLKVETDNNDAGSSNAPMETTSPKKSIEKPLGSPTETVHSASKAIESHSSKVPMPQSFSSKPVDPYSIKKQFVGASASSYVPKIQPRDDSYLVARPLHDSKAPLVTSHDDPVEKPEEEIPKLSLKERIALIQKQQEEEAEREAEAMRRKEERNKRKAEERVKLKHLKETHQDADVPSKIATHGTGDSIHTPTSPIKNNELPEVHDAIKETEVPAPGAIEPEAVDIEGDYKKDDPNFGERNVRAGDEDAQEEEEEEEEEEESDEDEISDIGKSTPLKLNTQNESVPPQQSNYNPVNITDSGSNTTNNITDKQGYENTEGFGTPFPNQISKYSIKPESPFASNELQSSVSPMYFDTSQSHQSPQLQPSTGTLEVLKASSLESPSKISESSNYLPLILRSINVSTIPSSYLMNNLISSKLLPSFTISDDDLENDLDITKSNEMIVKLGFLKEFLDFMSPNIIFDLGLMKNDESDYYINGVNDLLLNSDPGISSDWILNSLSKVFPCTYPMKLIELLYDFKSLELEDQLDSQLNFLNEIADEEDFVGPKALYRKLKALEWDSFSLNESNKTSFEKYKNVMEKLSAENTVSDDDYFKLPMVKTRILKNGNIVNLNNIGLKFWKYLNFSPVKKQKDFQILLIAETHRNTASYATEFLDQIIQNYKECNFGTISKVNLSTVETRSDLEPISDGLVLVHKEHDQSYNDFYIQTNKKLISLVELIKLDLINKTNNFEFGKPLLLFFIDFNDSSNSNVQVCKIFRNFKVALTTHQLPLVDIFTKIVPSSLLVKKVHHETALKVFSNYKLTKISMNLYNECPNDLANKSIVKNLFTTIVKDPPSKIQFKFMNSSYRDNSSNDDIFLHLAYERSIDNSWFVASWSDPLGRVVHVKSWYCSDSVSKSEKSTYRGDIMDIMSITDDIWSISTDLFKVLNDELGSFGGKKFLVLTRINSIIPDVELVHWKRLSSKHKEISLIVVSVRQTPRIVGSNESEDLGPKSNDYAPTPMIQDKDIFFGFKQTFSTSNTSSPSASGGALVTSPNSLSLHSPQQFLNAPANFLSPQDLIAPTSSGISGAKPGSSGIDPEVVLENQDNEVYGVIPKVPLPSFNSPTRFCMKTGYLMMQVNQPSEEEYKDDIKKTYLVYEINLLSCSNYWNLDVLMKLIMSQYKQMIALNDILCMNPIVGESDILGTHSRNNAIVPWHINAVGKLLDYLVHIYVDKD